MDTTLHLFPKPVLKLIEKSFNRYIGLSSAASRGLAELDGKLIQVVIRELSLTLVFAVRMDNVELLTQLPENVDCTIDATVFALLRMALTDNGEREAFGPEFEIRGDLETGRQFYTILKKVNIDWEEILSKYTGDIVAHKIGNGVRMFNGWSRNTAQRLGEDIADYLQEESRQLPSTFEVEEFIKQVDELRMAVDRADARIKRLVAKSAAGDSDL